MSDNEHPPIDIGAEGSINLLVDEGEMAESQQAIWRSDDLQTGLR